MKKRIGTYKGKPIIEGDPNLLNENEVFGGSRVYTCSTKKTSSPPEESLPEFMYASTFSCKENVLVPQREDVKCLYVIGTNAGISNLQLGCYKDVIPAGCGVLVLSKEPLNVEFKSTTKTPEVPIPTALIGFPKKMATKDVYNLLVPGSLLTDSLKDSKYIKIYTFQGTSFNPYIGETLAANRAFLVLHLPE